MNHGRSICTFRIDRKHGKLKHGAQRSLFGVAHYLYPAEQRQPESVQTPLPEQTDTSTSGSVSFQMRLRDYSIRSDRKLHRQKQRIQCRKHPTSIHATKQRYIRSGGTCSRRNPFRNLLRRNLFCKCKTRTLELRGCCNLGCAAWMNDGQMYAATSGTTTMIHLQKSNIKIIRIVAPAASNRSNELYVSQLPYLVPQSTPPQLL